MRPLVRGAVLLAVAALAAPAQDLTDLGADDWARREAAEQRLLDVGPAVLTAQDRAGGGSDPEVAHRARRIANGIRLEIADRERIWEALVAGSPWEDGFGMDAGAFRLDHEHAPRMRWKGGFEGWLDEIEGANLPVDLPVVMDGWDVRMGDLRFVYDPAAAVLIDPEDLEARLVPADYRSRRWDLDSYDPVERREALWRLSRCDGWHRILRPGGPTGRVGEMLRDPVAEVRAHAALAGPGTLSIDIEARVRALLHDPEDFVRREAVRALERFEWLRSHGYLGERSIDHPR